MKFTYVNVGWEGLVADATVLASAVQEGFRIPKGFFLEEFSKFKSYVVCVNYFPLL